MRDASKCRANDPRTCPYHGAIIVMNEAVERMSRNGNPNPVDLDTYFVARKQVEAAEEEFRKRQWMDELRDNSAEPATPEPRKPAARKPVNKSEAATRARTNKPGAKASSRKTDSRSRNNSRSQQTRPRVQRTPLVQAHVEYPPLFPVQIQRPDERGNLVFLTRHDKAVGTPNGIMLGASRKLSPQEREHLVGLLQYQHTVSTRDEHGKVKKVEPEDVNANHSEGSVYLKTQFNQSGSELAEFHSGLNEILKNGSQPRQDGTQKFPPFPFDAQVVVYYNS